MKNYKLLFILIIGVIVITSSCKKEDFDMPPFIEPSFTLGESDTLLTIAELKALHPLTVIDSYDTIKNNYFIKGIITGNDSTGNIYKTIYIQDTSGAIILSLDASDMYKKYKQGQEIYVKCKDMVYGLPYGGGLQLGGLFNNKPGRLLEAEIPNHLFKNKYPGNEPTPIKINGGTDLTFDKAFMLVQIDSVTFVDAGQTFFSVDFNLGHGTNRTITLKDGTTAIVRTSEYSTFKNAIIPAGKGTVVGVLGYYNGYQLLLRGTGDLIGFN